MEKSSLNRDSVAAIYCRVSTEEQAKLGQSLSVQLKTLQEYAESKGYRVYDSYTDEGCSGADFSRPQLTRLRGDVQEDRIDIVLATHLDRLGRDGPELLNLLYKEFKKVGVHAEFITEGLNSSDDKDELVVYIRAQQAAEFRKKLSQRSQASKVHLVGQGRWCGGLPPVGYELDRATHTLKVCPEEAELVKKIIEWNLQGWGPTAITYELNRLAYPSMTARVFLPNPRFCEVTQKEKYSKSCYLRKYHQDYHDHCIECIAKFADQAKLVEPNGIGKTTVSRILQQDLYKGHMVWGRMKNNHEEEGPKRSPTQRDDWVSSESSVNESLVTEEEFQEIERQRRANTYTPARTRQGTYLLAGVLKCGNCGSSMNGHTSGDYWTGYFCSTRRNKGPAVCDMGTIKARTIEPYVEERVRQFIRSIESESLFAEKQWNKESRLITNLREDIERIERLIEENNEASEQLLTLFEQGHTAPQIVKEKLEKLEEDRHSQEVKLRNRLLQLEDAEKETPSLKELQELAKDFDEIWESADIEDQKWLIRTLIDKITVYKDGRIKIIYAF